MPGIELPTRNCQDGAVVNKANPILRSAKVFRVGGVNSTAKRSGLVKHVLLQSPSSMKSQTETGLRGVNEG